MGVTAKQICILWIGIYSIIIISSMLVGFLLSIFAVKIISVEMVTTTGVLMPVNIPFFKIIILFDVILFVLYAFLYTGLNGVKNISPIGLMQKKNIQRNLKQ